MTAVNREPDHQKASKKEEEPTWNDYYEWLEGRKPRPLFLEAFGRFDAGSGDSRRPQAVDLGCGDGTETIALLAAGWRVLAIEKEPAAVARLNSMTPGKYRPRLETRALPFEEVELPRADFVYAGLSLPFCRRQHFERLWGSIKGCLRPGGRFAGQLFGVLDSWVDNPKMMFHSLEQVERLLVAGFEVEILREIDKEGEAFSGAKHWHIFEIIARRAGQ